MTKDILIVDDEIDMLQLLKRSLEPDLGCRIETAPSGQDALRLLAQKPFDLILADLKMPGMDGLELLDAVKREFSDLTVVMMTAFGGVETAVEAMRNGAYDFISKPFDTDELEAKINRLVREIELLRQLELLSISDGLTGLYNRRYFDTKILEEVQRAHRQNHDLFLAVLDVDNLKEINDKYGHPAGDKLLQDVGVTIRHCIRENVDWPFRYGGDEFGVILTQVSQDQALMTAERFIQSFDEKKMPLTGLSIGLARFIRSKEKKLSEDIADLVRRADIAMYKAKETGRNRVVLDQENGKHQEE